MDPPQRVVLGHFATGVTVVPRGVRRREIALPVAAGRVSGILDRASQGLLKRSTSSVSDVFFALI
jgi:hypothetical protein